MTAKQIVAEAKEVANRLVERFPDSPDALALGGSIYYAFGDNVAAGRCWDKCLEIDSDFTATWHMMGEAAWEHGEFKKAADCLGRATDDDSGLDGRLPFMLADSLMNLGKTKEAINVLERNAHNSSLSPDALFLLGQAYLDTGQYEKARDRLKAALVVDPRSSKVRFGLANVYARLGMADKARKYREEYARLKLQKLDQTTRGRASLHGEDLADMRPAIVKSYLNGGKIYASHGVFLQAEKHWLRAAALDPQNPEPRKLLEILYTGQGRREEALRVRQGRSLGRSQPAE